MLLKDLQAGRSGQQKPTKHQQNLGTITYETIKYLERTPCGLQTPEHVSSFMEAMKDFQLTKAEKLQLLNSRPSSLVEMHLMVEESEERFTTDEEMERLKNAIITHLPGPEPEPTAAEEENEEEGMEEGGEEEGEDYVAI